MADKLDKIDLKILKILQQNSKITNLDLSKRIGLPLRLPLKGLRSWKTPILSKVITPK